MTTFAEQVAAALDTHDALEAGSRVHKVVVDEIKALDPSVTAVDTGYFNHSYVPDLMVTWQEAGQRLPTLCVPPPLAAIQPGSR